jgi:lipoprotein-anchoring transpeptidase ErfK/SrfK
MAWFGAATLCTISGSAPAQQGSSLSSFKPTMEDVAPGVDHGDHDDDLPEDFQRQAVFYRSQQPIGTIIIDTHERHLYLIESQTRAVRYGIGVGRDGFTWQGMLQIARKAAAGGLGNPLGARVMYLGNTIYRIHGTNAPETIGQALLSGCFRLVNDDVIDLYDRVPVGTKVIVRQD